MYKIVTNYPNKRRISLLEERNKSLAKNKQKKTIPTQGNRFLNTLNNWLIKIDKELLKNIGAKTQG